MTLQSFCFKGFLTVLALAASLAPALPSEDKPETPATGSAKPVSAAGGAESAKAFDDLADVALLAMRQRAEELHMQGVAVIAYVPGNSVTGWSSKMAIVGHLKTETSASDPGSNLIAIAYSKAAEMADTLKPSGNAGRKPLRGEFGWEGGWIVEGKTGHIIAAFSGGASEDDVKVSKTGLEVFSGAL